MPAHAASPWSATPAAPVGPTRSHAARRAGYLVAACVDVVLLVLVNVWPGWESVPFLTAAAAEVVALLNVGLLVGVGISLVSAVTAPRWWREAGDAVSAGFALAILMRTLRVFPFTFSDEAWAWTVRLGLVVVIVGVSIGLVVSVVRLIGALVGHETDPT